MVIFMSLKIICLEDDHCSAGIKRILEAKCMDVGIGEGRRKDG